MLVRRRARETIVCGALGLALMHCTPDFDSLSSGGDDAASGTSMSGNSGVGGAQSEGGRSGATAGGAASAGVSGLSTAGLGGATGGSGGDVGAAGAAGTGGEGGAPGIECPWAPLAALHHVCFDDGLDGDGFVNAMATSTTVTTKGSSASAGWDGVVGRNCPGSWRVTAAFKGYATGSQADEKAFADLRFDPVDWTGGKAAHYWVRVSPPNAPISAVQVFVMSGASFLYRSVFDDSKFASGDWYEIVIPLAAGADYDATDVRRIGLQLILKRDGTSVPPNVDIWLDDVWVEQ